MRVDWRTDQHGRLITDYFPYQDGRSSNFSFDAAKMQFELEVSRYDLGETCIFRFRDVRHYAIALNDIDIVSEAFLWPLSNAPQPAHEDEDDPWALIFQHVRGPELDKAADRTVMQFRDGWLIAIYGNMDGRVAFVCGELELELVKVAP
jgi:hypothetical protein